MVNYIYPKSNPSVVAREVLEEAFERLPRSFKACEIRYVRVGDRCYPVIIEELPLDDTTNVYIFPAKEPHNG